MQLGCRHNKSPKDITSCSGTRRGELQYDRDSSYVIAKDFAVAFATSFNTHPEY